MDTNQIISLALPLVTLLLPYIIAHAFSLAQKGLASLPANRLSFVRSLVQDSVRAAEQVGVSFHLSGPQKKQWASGAIQAVLQSHGISVSPALIDALVESAVLEINKDAAPVATQLGFDPPANQKNLNG